MVGMTATRNPWLRVVYGWFDSCGSTKGNVMEVISKDDMRDEVQEVFDILFDTVGSLPEHLMKSEFWANSVVYALINLLVRIAKRGATKEQILKTLEEVWDDDGSPKVRGPGN